MVRRFGILYHLSLFGLLLRRVRLEDHSAENIRQAYSTGPVVYVLHTTSQIDWLALNRVLNRRRLPLAAMTAGMRGVWFRSLRQLGLAAWVGLKRLLSRDPLPDPINDGSMVDAILDGETTAAFLVSSSLTGNRPLGGVVEALIDAQERCDEPIQLVPVVVLWRRAPEMVRSEVSRMLLGYQDDPNPIQKLLHVARGSSQVIIQAGTAFDLAKLKARYPDETQHRLTRRLRILLRRNLYQESRVIRGPRIRPYRWIRRKVLGSPEVRGLVTDEAIATGKDEEKIRREVAKTLEKIAARFSFPAVRLFHACMSIVWNRIYAGIDISDEDLERIRAALRSGTPVLVPCHRSHLDYLLVSCVCFDNDIVIPHIVAGDNMSFWPVGALFRRCGAFFIKRKFTGDRVFPVVFKRYLQQLIRDGFPVEFFIEGGRSRTGKLLRPRFGVLSMVLDAAANGRTDREVSLLPVGISYEKIAEEKTFARELTGSKKREENLGQLVRAGRVLGKRFGRVYLRVGEPILVSEVFGNQPAPWSDLSQARKREALQEVGERLVYRIGQQMVILPSGLLAMGLLCQSRRGVRIHDLEARVSRLNALLRARGAAPAVSLSMSGYAIAEALDRFVSDKVLARLEDEDGDIIQLIADRRITLQYYGNGLLHFIAPLCLLATAVGAKGEGPHDPEVLLELFRFQVFLLRYEFALDPDNTLEDLERETLNELVNYGALATHGDQYVVADRERLDELAGLVRSYLESYRLVLRACWSLRKRDIDIDELPDKIQEYGRTRLAVDEIHLPESLVLSNLKNGITAFSEDGVLQLCVSGGIQFDERDRQRYLSNLNGLLREE